MKCCGRKPLFYKTKDGLQKIKDPHWYCCDCNKAYSPEGEQRENWAWVKDENGEFVPRKRRDG